MTQAGAAGSHFQLYRTSATSSVRWRLLGGNHRPLGRGALDFADVSDCLQSLAELVAKLPELVGQVGRMPGNQWSWRLSLAGVELATATHPYDRQIRAAHAQEQFRQRAATARVGDVVILTAARRWRSLPGPVRGGRPESVR